MTDRTATCPRHGYVMVCETQAEADAAGRPHGCPRCLLSLDSAPVPEAMTGDERERELRSWYGILTVPFARMHERIEALVGRPVYTHELVMEEALVNEARNRVHPTGEEAAIGRLRALVGPDRPIVVVEAQGEGDE